MFDQVTCELPLPDGCEARKDSFQTKSLWCCMDRFTIRADGRLIYHQRRFAHATDAGLRPPEHVADIDLDYHGDLEIHGETADGAPMCYAVRFTHGAVEWIRPFDDLPEIHRTWLRKGAMSRMTAPDSLTLPAVRTAAQTLPAAPRLVSEAGAAASFAWDEFFYAEHHNPYTQRAYQSAVRRFLAWCDGQGTALPQITPGMVGQYLVGLGGSAAKRNLHLSALRGFFDRLVQRHVVVLNPAASVKGVKEQVIEGKTPEITLDQARRLLNSIKTIDRRSGNEAANLVGLRDRAVLASLAYTACRAGALARLRLQDLQHDGEQYVLRFHEKGGKSREIPVRLDLQRILMAYLAAAKVEAEPKDRALFRSALRRTGRLTVRPLTAKAVCELVKRRLKDAGLPTRLSPHSFRVTAITDLLTQGVPLDDVQYLAGHASPRTTRLYDRRQKKVTRNIVERISIRVE